MRRCTEDGCDRRHHARGYCKVHYNAWGHRTGAFPPNPRRCSYWGCEHPHKARGLCKSHYSQMERGRGLFPVGSRPAPGRPVPAPYPPGPLLDRLDRYYPSERARADACRVSGTTLKKWRGGGRLTEPLADRVAIELGTSILALWGRYMEEEAA